MVKTATFHFNCPHCDALYQVVKAEAGPEAINGDIACRVCRGPLAARDREFVLKYFFLRKAGRRQVWGQKRPPVSGSPNSD
jgi:hypothetical protein